MMNGLLKYCTSFNTNHLQY